MFIIIIGGGGHGVKRLITNAPLLYLGVPGSITREFTWSQIGYNKCEYGSREGLCFWRVFVSVNNSHRGAHRNEIVNCVCVSLCVGAHTHTHRGCVYIYV